MVFLDIIPPNKSQENNMNLLKTKSGNPVYIHFFYITIFLMRIISSQDIDEWKNSIKVNIVDYPDITCDSVEERQNGIFYLG